METYKATIEIDCPTGYEVVGFREPLEGEMFCDTLHSGARGVVIAKTDFTSLEIIIRKSFVWPSWLNAASIAKDVDGIVFAYSEIAVLQPNERWIGGGYALLSAKWFNIDHGLDDVPFEQSLRINPNYQITKRKLRNELPQPN